MRVPLTVADFIERAELVYGDRIGIVDEPDQPAASWGELTWAETARLARAQAAGLKTSIDVVSEDSDRFSKISEVEGIKLTPAMKKRASDARSKGLTAEEYRRAIIRSHSKG